MRGWVVGLGMMVVAASSAAAQTAAPAAVGRSAPAGVKATATVDNAKARQVADERQKRWDERMRRATSSMCVGC